MKVTDAYNVSQVAALAGRRRRKRVDGVEESGATPPSTDQVLFSARSADVSRARGLALQAPEIRAGLVDSISAMISDGRYQVRGADVAPKLIQDHLTIARV